MKEKISIVKIGGSVMDDPKKLHNFLKSFISIDGKKILVHGGGNQASELSSRLGIESKKVNGRRITDKATLDIVVMVYAGLLNKNLVATLQSMQEDAVGISGVDGGLIKAVKRKAGEVDYGYVGDVLPENMKTDLLSVLLAQNCIPVISPICSSEGGELLNVNADTVAMVIASSLVKNYEVDFFYCFEKEGVLMNVNDPSTLVVELNTDTFKDLLAQKVIADGMLPKLENAFEASKYGVKKVMIMSFENIENGYGTVISAN